MSDADDQHAGSQVQFVGAGRAVESGEQEEIIIARNGVPAARLMPLKKKSWVRLGVAEGKYVIPDGIDADNDLIGEMFGTKP